MDRPCLQTAATTGRRDVILPESRFIFFYQQLNWSSFSRTLRYNQISKLIYRIATPWCFSAAATSSAVCRSMNNWLSAALVRLYIRVGVEVGWPALISPLSLFIHNTLAHLCTHAHLHTHTHTHTHTHYTPITTSVFYLCSLKLYFHPSQQDSWSRPSGCLQLLSGRLNTTSDKL